ncbi:MAG: Pectin degradation repressor protein KdgR [Paracidovorax wautersii]|uniref:Pectin degradation repressor protein KdgR n=1 Tax=Paracidovorax wautersii TaxID=1177982 RepID=A0A7V8JP28_9BURK|nr:MAG: Pectin degradation repressor protein KdgR [Paracidovorax wautersii]
MTKITNVLSVLGLFDDDHHQLSAKDIAVRLNVSMATAYRYIADLEEAGYLERGALGWYALGAAIVELDWQVRLHDPLITAAHEVMRSLSERTGGTVLLARVLAGKVVCVDQVEGRHGPRSASYERGRAMPLYRGATSTVILANLDDEALASRLSQEMDEFRKAGLPTQLADLKARLESIRQRGIAYTAGAVDKDAMGWAVAIRGARGLLGSLSVILQRDTSADLSLRVADPLQCAALRIQGRLLP